MIGRRRPHLEVKRSDLTWNPGRPLVVRSQTNDPALQGAGTLSSQFDCLRRLHMLDFKCMQIFFFFFASLSSIFNMYCTLAMSCICVSVRRLNSERHTAGRATVPAHYATGAGSLVMSVCRETRYPTFP